MKSILITGITGFVGSHLTDHLLSADPPAEIWGLRRVNGRMRNICHTADRVRWIEGDLTDPVSVDEALRASAPDEIYHLGALSWVSPSWSMPSAYMQVNAIGTINLLEAVRRRHLDPRILVSCTPEEFGDVDPKDLPITEATPVAPVNHYAASKLAQDAVCMSYVASYRMKIIRTRAFNHEGPRRDVNGALASFAHQIARIERGLQDPVVKVGNLEAKRSFTDVRDMVRAYRLAMMHCLPGQLYLIGSDTVRTIKECVEYLIGLSTCGGITYSREEARVRPTELRYLVGDYALFRRTTGWAPQIPFEQTLTDILNYWRGFIDNRLY